MTTDLQLFDAAVTNTVALADRDANPAAVYLAGLTSPGSRLTMCAALNGLARIVARVDSETDGNGGRVSLSRSRLAYDVPWALLRHEHTAAIRAELAMRYSPKTANRMISALRGVLKAAWRLGLMTADDYARAADVRAVKGERVPAGRAIAQGELVALLGTCDTKPIGVRDAAMLSVLYGCGLRRAEIVSLSLNDYCPSDESLVVRGKGNKERRVPLPEGARRALVDWLAVRGSVAGPLFVGIGGRNRGGRLTTQAIYVMLHARARAAGVVGLSPHDLRRTFVGDLLDAGADIATVQKLAGHANVTTTAQYDRRGERAKRAAVDKLHVPYVRRSG